MSGEYYRSKEPVSKFYKDYESHSAKTKESIRPPSRGNRLHDIEEQLEMAETRCNSLKDQLDHMKQVYGIKKQNKNRKISNISSGKKVSDDDVTCSSASLASYDDKRFPRKQCSTAIGTDNTGAAVRTINNILNGITNSVNRLSELHVQIAETPRRSGRSPHLVMNLAATKSSESDNIKTTESETPLGPNTSSAIRISSKSKNIKKKQKDTKMLNRKPQPKTTKRSLNNEKRSRMSSTRTSVPEKICPSMPKPRQTKSILSHKNHENIVEIYHNIAAKQSDSDESNMTRKKNRDLIRTSTQTQIDCELIPPLTISDKADVFFEEPTEKRLDYYNRATTSRNPGTLYEPLDAPRTVSCCYSKNYELPTIASKMKQVAKCYLDTFSFRQAIPFCAAISTSPSHNIGINIQQVMNIIKTRNPMNGISPTLAHNIGLAAERLNSKPLSQLVSTIQSTTNYKPSQCPLSRAILNYQQLQDLARGIPEETAEEMEEVDCPEINTIIITGPSGDMEVKNKNGPIWAADPAHSQQCTCAPQQGVDFQHIINKYKRPGTGTSLRSSVSERNRRYPSYKKNAKNVTQRKSQAASKNGFVNVQTESRTINQVEPSSSDHPLDGKEKNLKEVLMNLHDEFENLNKKYEDLSQKTSSDDETTLKDLEELEKELNKKEEEITMVMTLYKEVLALKQQVKMLKQKTSQGSIVADSKEISNFTEYNNPRAALHLTKLLRQIQMYQMRYKKNTIGA